MLGQRQLVACNGRQTLQQQQHVLSHALSTVPVLLVKFLNDMLSISEILACCSHVNSCLRLVLQQVLQHADLAQGSIAHDAEVQCHPVLDIAQPLLPRVEVWAVVLALTVLHTDAIITLLWDI